MYGQINFEEFENDVMKMLLDGNDSILTILRDQYQNAKKTKNYSGKGFFVDFEIPASILRLDPPRSFELGDVDCQMDGVQYGIGFVLFIKNGSLIALEGYTYGEKWPDEITNYRLSYDSGKKRDIKILEEKWKS